VGSQRLDVGAKPPVQLIDLHCSVFPVKDGSSLGNNSMDTSLDLFQDMSSIKRQDNLPGDNSIRNEIVGSFPMTIDDNFFENGIDT